MLFPNLGCSDPLVLNIRYVYHTLGTSISSDTNKILFEVDVGVIRAVAGLAPPLCWPRYGRPLRGRLELHYDRPEDRFLRKTLIYLLKRILSSRRRDPRSGARNGARSGRP